MCSVALLRAVNVGGNNKVPMAELRAALTDAGLRDVRTYIQSGNLVFDADRDPAAAAGLIEQTIQERFGVTTTAILRGHEELERALFSHPFSARATPEKFLHILFLRDEPDPDRVARLDPARDPAAEFAVIGREMHVRYGNGAGTSKLTSAYIDRVLGTPSTARNLRTVRTLLEMMGAV